MSDQPLGTNEFTDLFREEAAGLLGLLSTSGPAEPAPPSAVPVEPPVMPKAEPVTEEALRTYWRSLRTFFRTGKTESLPGNGRQVALFPALLAPFRDRPALRQHYPCWMVDAKTIQKHEDAGADLLTLSQLVQQTVEAFAPGEKEAVILKDNLLRLERRVQEKLRLVDAAFQSYALLTEALDELVAELALKGTEGEGFVQDVDRMKKQLPKTGVLIPFARHAPFHILATLLSVRQFRRREAVREAVAPLIARLSDLLAVEQEKSPDAQSPEHLHATLDFADEWLSFDELSAMLPSGGGERMPEERVRHIEKIKQTLQQAEAVLSHTDAYFTLGRELREYLPDANWKQLFPVSTLQMAETTPSCAEAATLFDRISAEAAGVFAAIRMAKLELDHQYVPDIHDDFFAHFDWRSFSDWEWSAFPPVVVLNTAQALTRTELNDFSSLLASSRPVKIMALSSGFSSGTSTKGLTFPQEPGALAIAHRNTYVLQTAAIDPMSVSSGLEEGLAGFTPALFHLSLFDHDYLPASAEVEGRAFPGFIYNSLLGPRWGSRFDIGRNPQPEADWPVHPLTVLDEKGKPTELSIPFTFGDFAAQHPSWSGLFHVVPPACWSDDLIGLADYLQLEPQALYTKVPFIWMVDDRNQLQKAAVAFPVVLACQDRLDFWHFLQENAGIHSYHVEQATEKLRRQLQQETERQLTLLQENHRQEIETVKTETARAAMEQLAAMLLDMDVSAGLTPAPPRPVDRTPAVPSPGGAVESPTPPQPAAPAEPEVEAEEVLPPGEAWVETPLCTSCNECKDINPRIFQYNADKQAYVVNPRGGPFADIVRAAEKCPARIIHPGAPQDPNEAGLEELIKRAAVFN